MYFLLELIGVEVTRGMSTFVVYLHTQHSPTHHHKQQEGEINPSWYNTTLLEKYPTLFYFCKNLVDFNEVRLHEATLNLHTH